MPSLLPLLVFFPLASAIFLFVTAGRLSARTVGWVATGAIGLSALCSITLACFFSFQRFQRLSTLSSGNGCTPRHSLQILLLLLIPFPS